MRHHATRPRAAHKAQRHTTHRNAAQAPQKRYFYCGMREVRKAVRSPGTLAVIVAPNIGLEQVGPRARAPPQPHACALSALGVQHACAPHV